jgi:hypothetical protein
MPQATAQCTTPILLCAMRISRLDADGSLAAGPNNAYITNNPTSLGLNPNIKAGLDEDVVGGCGCVCVSYKGPDTLKRFDLDFEFCALEPGLIEILTGSPIVMDDSDVPVPIGASFPNQLNCSDPQQPPFAIEAWAQGFIDDRQAPDPASYIRFVLPMAFANFDSWVVSNQFLLPKLKGYTRSNPTWPADGSIYDDYPAGAELGALGGWFQDSADHVPVAECAYQTASSG